MNSDLQAGMSDGKYKKLVAHRGDVAEGDLLYSERMDLSDTYYGIHETPVKRLPDGTVDRRSRCTTCRRRNPWSGINRLERRQ
jgi:hypothetical protein